MDNLRVILFKNVTNVLKAEKLLKELSIPHKLIPVPKSISSECGICLRFEISQEVSILNAISDTIDYIEIVNI